MRSKRICSKLACQQLAGLTLTYHYGESTVVIGPLSQRAEPHAYDLCQAHADLLNAPVGWELLRVGEPVEPEETDDILAIANALQDTEPEPEPVYEGLRIV